MPAPAEYVPRHPLLAACYIAAAILISLTQGLGLNLMSVNLTQIQGSLGATTNESAWLIAAYLAPNVSLTLLLTKVRAEFGLRRFAEGAIVVFVLVTLAHLFVSDLRSAIVVRFFAGCAASPMSSLGFLYMLESFPPARKLSIGMTASLTLTAAAMPIARLISPTLVDLGGWNAMFLLEVALAMMSYCAIYLLPLTAPARAKVIEPLDVLSYLLIAIGLGSIVVALTVGPYYWWFEARWLGVLLAVGGSSLTAAVLIELNRDNPLVDFRWIASPEILHFAGVLLLFRLILAEQTSGAYGLFTTLGLLNDQLVTLYTVILGATFVAGAFCAAVLTPDRVPAIHALALALLAVGAFLDGHSTSLTRPEQMYVSQAMIAAAGTLFLPPAMSVGFVSAMKRGTNYILSFLIVFLVTQSIGGAMGSAIFRTVVTIREKYHSHYLVEGVVLTDPTVAQRAAQYGAAYAKTLADPVLQRAEGVSLIAQQATREANVLAYNDAFLLVSATAAFGLFWLLAHQTFKWIKALQAPHTAPPAAA
ncbi:MFS transporter [Mangrovicella endophytica]|uniref:MFS transporter n=1 Tax=Mangrovicella endophytica TaxID=2066697 RepID=UPI003CC9EC54